MLVQQRGKESGGSYVKPAQDVPIVFYRVNVAYLGRLNHVAGRLQLGKSADTKYKVLVHVLH